MAYHVLKTFTQTLLNNTANSGKTSDIMLNVSYEDLKKHINEQKEYKQTLTEKYMTNHELIRREKLFAYNIYVSDKATLKNEWQRTQDIGALHDFIKFAPPENLLKPQDPIYTIHSS